MNINPVIFVIVVMFLSFLITIICHLFQFNFCCYKGLDKVLFTNFKQDSSKRNAILAVFLFILVTLTYFTNIYNMFLSEKITKSSEYTFFMFLKSIGNNYTYLLIPLGVLFLSSYISAFLINKFIEEVFPLKDGVDKNSQEENTIIRFGTWCKIINSLPENKIKSIANEVGKEFGKSINITSLDLKEKTDIKILEKKWNKTDSDLARFYQRIKFNDHGYGFEISLEIIGPFWNNDFHEHCNFPLENYPNKERQEPIECLHKICAFNYYYIEGVLQNAKNFKSLSIKCLDDEDKGRMCSLLNQGKCFFIIKTK